MYQSYSVKIALEGCIMSEQRCANEVVITICVHWSVFT